VSAVAVWQLLHHACVPARLAPAIRATIVAVYIEGVLVAVALFMSRGEMLA
jgi:hypothetical protein